MQLNLTRLSHFIEYKYFNLHYKKIGSGPKIIFAFHGFGQDASAYNCIVNQLNKYYTIYVVELFFHGQTVWKKNDLFLDKQIWREFFLFFLKKEKIKRFSILGFSIGAKLALASYEATPHQVTHVILIAPDGIRQNFWYSLAVSSGLGRFMFRFLLNKTQVFSKILAHAHNLGLINKTTQAFITKQVLNPENTAKIYKTWLVFKAFKFNPQQVSQSFNQGKTDISIFIGNKDPWFTLKTINPISRRINKLQIIQLDANHQKMLKAFCQFCRLNPEVIKTF